LRQNPKRPGDTGERPDVIFYPASKYEVESPIFGWESIFVEIQGL
jgi:hypothetical protein